MKKNIVIFTLLLLFCTAASSQRHFTSEKMYKSEFNQNTNKYGEFTLENTLSMFTISADESSVSLSTSNGKFEYKVVRRESIAKERRWWYKVVLADKTLCIIDLDLKTKK